MNALILNGRLKHQHHLDPIHHALVAELETAGWSTESIFSTNPKLEAVSGASNAGIQLLVSVSNKKTRLRVLSRNFFGVNWSFFLAHLLSGGIPQN